MKVYGPYTREDGRKHVIHYDGGTSRTQSYPRYLMEQHLGRELEQWETVDHINEDATDDRIENLQILTLSENIRKSAASKELVIFVCPVCGTQATKEARNVRANIKRGSSGPFCSRSCAGTFNSMRQHHGIELD